MDSGRGWEAEEEEGWEGWRWWEEEGGEEGR
jgi:hypothetical protein